jgi:hypothetical protein
MGCNRGALASFVNRAGRFYKSWKIYKQQFGVSGVLEANELDGIPSLRRLDIERGSPIAEIMARNFDRHQVVCRPVSSTAHLVHQVGIAPVGFLPAGQLAEYTLRFTEPYSRMLLPPWPPHVRSLSFNLGQPFLKLFDEIA